MPAKTFWGVNLSYVWRAFHRKVIMAVLRATWALSRPEF